MKRYKQILEGQLERLAASAASADWDGNDDAHVAALISTAMVQVVDEIRSCEKDETKAGHCMGGVDKTTCRADKTTSQRTEAIDLNVDYAMIEHMAIMMSAGVPVFNSFAGKTQNRSLHARLLRALLSAMKLMERAGAEHSSFPMTEEIRRMYGGKEG